MYEIRKLKDHQYSQCKVALSANEIIFTSYTTEVIRASMDGKGGYIISCTGLYSTTTRKQIGWFLNEYFPTLNFHDIKAIAGTKELIYIDRYGKILEWEEIV